MSGYITAAAHPAAAAGQGYASGKCPLAGSLYSNVQGVYNIVASQKPRSPADAQPEYPAEYPPGSSDQGYSSLLISLGHVQLATHLPAGLHGLLKMYEHWTYSVFFCVAELWGAIVISVLSWTLANELCTVSEAKTVYPLVGIAANCALVLAGNVMKYVNRGIAKVRMVAPGIPPWAAHGLPILGRLHFALQQGSCAGSEEPVSLQTRVPLGLCGSMSTALHPHASMGLCSRDSIAVHLRHDDRMVVNRMYPRGVPKPARNGRLWRCWHGLNRPRPRRCSLALPV